MILFFHITSAIFSLVSTILAMLNPSTTKLKVTAGLFASTVLSGGAMLMFGEVRLGRLCIIGVVYTFFVITSLVFVRKRLISLSTNPK